MKASLVFKQSLNLDRAEGGEVIVFMDCSRMKADETFELMYRFSWIAYDSVVKERRVLMDQHPGKTAHVHFDDHEEEITARFDTLDQAMDFFFAAVTKHFGPILNEVK